MIRTYDTNICVDLFNRAQKKVSAISAWENSKKANLEAKLRQIEVISNLCSYSVLGLTSSSKLDWAGRLKFNDL